jgi:hypothetical protein
MLGQSPHHYDPRPASSTSIECIIREMGTDPADKAAVVRLARSLLRQHIKWLKTEGVMSDWNKRMRNDAHDMVTFARYI